MGARVEVLLSTYNGERYLSEQLDSILEQSYSDLVVLVRDDCSTDESSNIIKDYQKRHSARIKVFSDSAGNLGCAKSFMALLEASSAEYVMFADQDDVWLPNKVEVSLEKVLSVESLNGKSIPILAFSDLIPVSENLECLNKSFWCSQKNDVSIVSDWRKLFARNVVTGCTILMNRAAVEESLPFPDIDVLHDQWVALNVARKGKVVAIEQPTILYRQHSANVEGAKSIGLTYMVGRLRFKYLYKNLVLLIYLSRKFEASIVSLLFFKLWINCKRIF